MDTGEQFSLCWNNFHTNLSNGFNNLLRNEDLVDVTLAAEGRFIKAHKTVLSICSPFFNELFKVNPCKHPIVILPEVSYNALKSLLHFMYQGEVSVSQEEIPTFMRVAETLKVKGLTDNAPDATNGFQSTSSYGEMETRKQDILKRPRPIKKLIRPMQPLRPLENPLPKLSPSPQPSILPTIVQSQSVQDRSCIEPIPLKRPHIEATETSPVPSGQQINNIPPSQLSPSTTISTQNQALSLVKKEEPVDHSEEEAICHNDEMSTELTNILDAQLSGGEPSPIQQIAPWPTPALLDANPVASRDDNSQPGTIQCILGRRGIPRLIVDGYAFYKKSVYKGKASWYCKNSRAVEKCQAVCKTMNGNIVKWPHGHNHPISPDNFNPGDDVEVPIENLQEVLRRASF